MAGQSGRLRYQVLQIGQHSTELFLHLGPAVHSIPSSLTLSSASIQFFGGHILFLEFGRVVWPGSSFHISAPLSRTESHVSGPAVQNKEMLEFCLSRVAQISVQLFPP